MLRKPVPGETLRGIRLQFLDGSTMVISSADVYGSFQRKLTDHNIDRSKPMTWNGKEIYDWGVAE